MFTVIPKLLGENNRDYAYKVIKEAIMSLEIVPGQSISEVDLADALKLSRTPIREVLTKLREEHLIEVIPQVGTNISKIKPKLVEEAVFARITLEKEILKLSCKAFPIENLLMLKKNINKQELLIGQKEKVKEFHQLDREFHYIIFQGNKKENVWAAITRLSTHYNRVRILSEKYHGFDDAINQHKNLFNAIENKEDNQVENFLKEHIIDPMNLWEELYKESSPYFEYFDLNDAMPVF